MSAPASPAPARVFAPGAADALVAAITFDAAGLVPAIALDAGTGAVRMFAYANAAAVRATLESGHATFFSRSRQALWRKGAESGHVLVIEDVRVDCDGDALLYLCAPVGPSCHTGKTSCFFRAPGADGTLVEDDGPAEVPAAILGRLARVIRERRREAPDKSYVASLLTKGLPKINAKITEEAGELTEALTTGTDKLHVAKEAADVFFHVMVGLEAAGVSVDDVFAELRRRFGVGGHVEKAARPPKPAAG